MRNQSKFQRSIFVLKGSVCLLALLSLCAWGLAKPASAKDENSVPNAAEVSKPVQAAIAKSHRLGAKVALVSGPAKSLRATARNAVVIPAHISGLAKSAGKVDRKARISGPAKSRRAIAPKAIVTTALANAPVVQTQQDPIPFIAATAAFDNSPVCGSSDLGSQEQEARSNPEWKRVLGLNIDKAHPVLDINNDPPTILEGFVAHPPADLKPDDQPTSEVSEEEIPWNHYTHDFTFKVVPDTLYQHLLSSYVRFQGLSFPINNPDDPIEVDACIQAGGVPDGNKCVIAGPDTCRENPDTPLADTCHHTSMEVEWENASLMDENGAFQRTLGAVPEFVWPGVGDRVWVAGRWIFDCGHPNAPAADPIKDLVQFATEIHPPRALVAFRLNHPALDSFPTDRISAPSFAGPQSNLPVTGFPVPLAGGEPTRVAVTEADIFVSGNGGGANDLCMIVALDGSDCRFGHTTSVIPVNNTNYVFDVYPPGTDYKTVLENGTFAVTPPVADASLQWRMVNHFSELPAHTCGTIDNRSCVTVDPIVCLIDASTPPPTQAETKCPEAPANPTRLRVILPFAGSAANYFAQSILLGWDDVPVPGVNHQVRTFKITLHKFTIGQNGESFLHSGDWRVFVNVGGQYRYVDPLFDRNSDGSNKCGGESLTDNGDDDCFQFDQTPWIVSVQDDTPIHVAVGGWESDLIDGRFCNKFPPDGDCDPFGTVDLIILGTQNNDRIGPYEFDLLPENNYQWVSGDGALLDRFATHKTKDGERYIVEFRVEEIPADTPPTSPQSQLGTPHFGNFVSSATPIVLSSPSAGTEGFQYRTYAVGAPLPVYAFSPPQPFPVHWTHVDLPAGSQSVPVFLSGADGPNNLQFSAESVANLLEPRHRETLVLDNTPPVITINQPTATQYTHADTLTIDYDVSDGAGSGVKSSTATIDGRTTLPGGRVIVNGMKIDLFSELSLGTHTFSVTATDNVDNAATKSVTFSIIVTPDSLEQDVNILLAFGCIDNGGIANSLVSKIEAAKSRIAAGDTHSAINTLAALLNQLQAQAGKHISTGCTDPNTNTQFNPAQLLITDLQALLANLKTAGVVNPILGYVLTATDGVGGAVVSLLDASNVVVATANTDATGFYFFAQTNALVTGASYTVRVSTIPKPNTTSTPASQTFTWSATQVSLGNFQLN
jgi:hypothetical protein